MEEKDNGGNMALEDKDNGGNMTLEGKDNGGNMALEDKDNEGNQKPPPPKFSFKRRNLGSAIYGHSKSPKTVTVDAAPEQSKSTNVKVSLLENTKPTKDRTYQVLWRKQNTKVRKTWENDGILTIRANGTEATLRATTKTEGEVFFTARPPAVLRPGLVFRFSGLDVEITEE